MAKSTGSSAGSPASRCDSSSRDSGSLDGRRAARWPASPMDRRKRLAANARERKRMHLLNQAYDELRRRLVDAQNKSKYDVLVQAKEYIQALATICEKFDQQNPNHPSVTQHPHYLEAPSSRKRAPGSHEPPSPAGGATPAPGAGPAAGQHQGAPAAPKQQARLDYQQQLRIHSYNYHCQQQFRQDANNRTFTT